MAVRCKLDVVQVQDVALPTTLCGPCTQVGVAGRPPNNVQVSDMTLTGRTCRCGYVGNALRFGLEIMRSEKAGMIRHDGSFSDLKMTKYLDSLKMDSLK